MPNCQQTIADCLTNLSSLACCTREELARLKCAIISEMGKVLCSSGTCRPVEMGGVKFPSQQDCVRALRGLLDMVILLEKHEGAGEVVMETVWREGCGKDACLYVSEECGPAACQADSVFEGE